MTSLRPGRSWSGTVDYGPGPLHAPTSIAQLQAFVGRCTRIRALGTRHSFSEVAATDADLVTLERLPKDIEVDSAARTVRVGAGVRYGELAPVLHRHGLALSSMGSLPHISVGGASATGTHGSGDANRVLAAGVRRIELVGADGDLIVLDREQDPAVFGGAVLALGCLGVAALVGIGERVRPLVQVAELRSIVADDLWLLPAQGRDSVGLHVTWHDDPVAVQALLPELEAVLAPFAPRPHWGKVFTMAAETVRSRYPRLGDFLDLRESLDPQRVFANAFTDRLLGA